MSASRSDRGDANSDPITGEVGSRPVGGGMAGAAVGGPVGAMVGGAIVGGLAGHGIAVGINPTAEDAYWRESYRTRPYVDPHRPYDDYQPAYRYGWESRARYANRRWEEVEADLERGWEAAKSLSRLTWNDARQAVRDAWLRAASSLTADEDAYRQRVRPKNTILRRTPHMDLLPPQPLAASEAFAVAIYADTQPARAGERAREIAIDAPAEIRRCKFEVFLQPSAHFRIEGPLSQTLILERDQPRSETVSFELRVVEDPGRVAGTPEITAYFYCGNLQSGVVSRQIEIAGIASGPSADASRSDTVAHDIRGVPADLQVDVLRTPAGEGRTFVVRVRTSLLPGWREWQNGIWSLERSTSDIVSGYMKEFISSELSDKERLWQLVGAGKQLFKAAPEIFRQVFWELLDAGAPLESISIVSAEPYIPWELMVPIRWKNGRREERQPLGVEFNISRWSSSDHTAPSPRIPLVDSVVVAPRDSRLKKREQEVAVVLKRFPGHRVDPAAAEALDDWLSAKETTLLHFICHGKSGIKETVKIEDGQVHIYVNAESVGEQMLTFENGKFLNTARLEGMKGLGRALAARRPLVFLNACETGRLVPVLVGPGGFAQTFMELGAAGVVAALWSVRDSIAHEIAVEFYRRVKEEPGVPFAQILRDIRKKAYEPGGGEDTYAAYCFYGDPRATAAGD